MPEKPQILHVRTVARTRIFQIEQLDLQFSNGTTVQYERLKGSSRGAVLIVPLLNRETVLLIREYAVGVDRYELAFPKGRIEGNESPEVTANREIMEEIGYGANKLTYVTSMTLAPGYHGHVTHLVIAEDLFEKRLEGDEPEEIEVVPWRLESLHELLAREDFTEARSIAALYLAREYIRDGE